MSAPENPLASNEAIFKAAVIERATMDTQQRRERCLLAAISHLQNRGTSAQSEVVELAKEFETFIKGEQQ